MLHTNSQTMVITAEFKKDINWFLTFLPHFNGVTFMDKRPIQVTVELDACLTGIRARYDNAVYAYTFIGVPQSYSTLCVWG